MISYYEVIKRLYTEEEFEMLLNNQPIPPCQDEIIDISPGSGFHFRQRKNRKLCNEK